MLRERLKDMELRITELADYLQISRPTMYKFIEYYDMSKFDAINKNVLALFNYIEENELAGKKNVVNYILTHLVKVDEASDGVPNIVDGVAQYLRTNPSSKKSIFITTCFFDEYYNDLFCYFADIAPLLKKKKISASEKQKIQPFLDLKRAINHSEEK